MALLRQDEAFFHSFRSRAEMSGDLCGAEKFLLLLILWFHKPLAVQVDMDLRGPARRRVLRPLLGLLITFLFDGPSRERYGVFRGESGLRFQL